MMSRSIGENLKKNFFFCFFELFPFADFVIMISRKVLQLGAFSARSFKLGQLIEDDE